VVPAGNIAYFLDQRAHVWRIWVQKLAEMLEKKNNCTKRGEKSVEFEERLE